MSIANTQTESGDDCHYEILNVNDEDSEKFAETYCNYPNLFICLGAESWCLSADEISDLPTFVAEHL